MHPVSSVLFSKRREYKHYILSLIVLFAWNFTALSALKVVDGVYQIANALDLQAFIHIVESGNQTANAALVDDIDFRRYQSMIGSVDHPYQGIFDGCCHKIQIEYDSDGMEVALFQRIGKGGEVKNLQVSGTISSHNRYAAGLVSDLAGGTINNCLITVDIFSDYDGDCTYGGISGFTTLESTIRNCVYSGTISAPLGKRVGGLVGWVDSPGTLVENCIAVCDAELGSKENSNSVARSHDNNYVTLNNVYYVNEISSSMKGAKKVTIEDLQNGKIFYQVMGNEIHSAGQLLDEQERSLRLAQVRFRLILIIAVLLFILLLLLMVLYRYRRSRDRLLYQKLRAEHALWEGRQQNYMDFLSQPKVKIAENDGSIAENNHNSSLGEIKQTDLSPLKQDTMKPDFSANDNHTFLSDEFDEKDNSDLDESEESDEHGDSQLKSLYHQLQHNMVEKQYYTDPNLDIKRLALLVGTNRSSLSRCINRFSDGKNFNLWLAEYRVNSAINLMDNIRGQFSPEEIATRSGFNSRSTFYRQFKMLTGLTPKQYLHNRP